MKNLVVWNVFGLVRRLIYVFTIREQASCHAGLFGLANVGGAAVSDT